MSLRRSLSAACLVPLLALAACPSPTSPPSGGSVAPAAQPTAPTTTDVPTAAPAPTGSVPAPAVSTPPTSPTASTLPTASAPPSGSTPGQTTACAGSPPSAGYVCAQTCGPPVVRPTDPPPPFAWMDPSHVRNGRQFPCPICLPDDARIATPAGDVRARDVRAGTLVFTADASGHRIVAPVLGVGSTEVPATHTVVRVTLADGRVVRASAGHPTADGTPLGRVHEGDLLDGARVASVQIVPYLGGRTYDLLPAGPTGAYWADGVLIGSTLTDPARSRCSRPSP
jgi:hypothetical protein